MLQVRGTADVAGHRRLGQDVRRALVDARSGIAVNDIAADISIGAGTATIRRADRHAVDARQPVGLAARSASIRRRGFPADLSVKITDGRYTDGRVVTANLGGDLAIKGPLASAPVLSGTINLAKTVITVPERLPGSLSALDVKHKNAPARRAGAGQGAAPANDKRRRWRQRACPRRHGQRAATRSSSRAAGSMPSSAAR